MLLTEEVFNVFALDVLLVAFLIGLGLLDIDFDRLAPFWPDTVFADYARERLL